MSTQHIPRRALRIGTIMGCLVVAVACGSGGGSGGDGGGAGGNGGGGGSGALTNAVFDGTYAIAAFSALRSASAPANADVVASWGRALADGQGTLTLTLSENDNGLLTGSMPASPMSYTVAGDGTLSLANLTGGVTVDGSAAVLMGDPGENPSIALLLRISGPYSNTNLSGTYHSAQIQSVATAAPGLSIWGSFSAYGDGSADVAGLMLNMAGTVSADAGATTSYGVAADGTATAELLRGTCTGAVTRDGNFFVGAGDTLGVEQPFLGALIRRSSGATDATFQGNYWAVGIWSDPANDGDWTSILGTVHADGAGKLDYRNMTENVEGSPGAHAGPDTYAVAPDGTLSGFVAARAGAISSDGKFAFLTGETAATTTPILFLFVRK